MLASDTSPERQATPINYYQGPVRLCEPSPSGSVLSLPINLSGPSIPAAAKLRAIDPEPLISELAQNEAPFQSGESKASNLDNGSSRRAHQSYKEWLLMLSLWRRKYSTWPSLPWQFAGEEIERGRWWTRDEPNRLEEGTMSSITERPQLPEQLDGQDDNNEENRGGNTEERPRISQQLYGLESGNDTRLTRIKRPRRADLVAESYSRNSSSIIEINLEGETLASPSIQQEHNVETIVDHDPALPQPFPRKPSQIHLSPRKSSPWTSSVDIAPRYGLTQVVRSRRKQTSTESAEPTKRRRRRELSSLAEQGWGIISLPRIRREYWRYHILNRTPLWLSGDDDDREAELLLEVEPETIDLEPLPFPNTTPVPSRARKRRQKITRRRLKLQRALQTLSTLLSLTASKLGQFLTCIPKLVNKIQWQLRLSVQRYRRKHWTGYTMKLYVRECWTNGMLFLLPWAFAIQQAITTCLVIEFEGWYFVARDD
ncbi:MAG: hypothetical protein M1835_006196 [Candelina submexicana]|nr:MAG: hypothetical protein M1835_006196 [Candelina submexicana]